MMPLRGSGHSDRCDPYFESLSQLDDWANRRTRRLLGTVPHASRSDEWFTEPGKALAEETTFISMLISVARSVMITRYVWWIAHYGVRLHGKLETVGAIVRQVHSTLFPYGTKLVIPSNFFSLCPYGEKGSYCPRALSFFRQVKKVKRTEGCIYFTLSAQKLLFSHHNLNQIKSKSLAFNKISANPNFVSERVSYWMNNMKKYNTSTSM
jgi:hypothetical protein